MVRFGHMINELKPIVMMVAVQAGIAGVNVFYKLASNDGMSIRVLVAYRSLFASAAVVPLALCFERNCRPKLTWMVVFQASVCSLFATLTQNFYGQGLATSSATIVAASTNLMPALTFIMAVLFGLEKFELKTKAGKARVIGTVVCTCGAMILTFYKGVEIKLWPIHAGLLHKDSRQAEHLPASHPKATINHILGSIYGIAGAISAAVGLIFRAKLSERFPYHYSSTALMCLTGSLQASVFALCMENKHWNRWKLGWNIRLLSVVYSGVVVSGLVVVLTMWCVRMKGPLFVSVFSPLALVLVAILSTLLLEERLHLGSVLGAVVIVCGLYTVIWGNALQKRIPSTKPSSEKSAHQQDDEPSSKIAENDKDAKSCDAMAIGVAPNSSPTPEIDSSHDNNNGEKDDHHLLEEGHPITKGQV